MAKNVEFTYYIYISAPVVEFWKGIVDGEMARHYVYGDRQLSLVMPGNVTRARVGISTWAQWITPSSRQTRRRGRATDSDGSSRLTP